MCARSCALCPSRALASRATRASAGVHSRALPCPCGVAGARAPVEPGTPREGRSHDRRSVFYFGIALEFKPDLLIRTKVINKYNR